MGVGMGMAGDHTAGLETKVLSSTVLFEVTCNWYSNLYQALCSEATGSLSRGLQQSGPVWLILSA